MLIAFSPIALVADEPVKDPQLLALTYCSSCHLAPAPEAITKEHWPTLFDLMKGWILERRLPFVEADYAGLLAHFQSHAPEQFEPVPDEFPESPIPFQRGEVGRKCTAERPKITHVLVTDLDKDGSEDVLVCDDVAGRVSWLKVSGGSWNEIDLAEIKTPVKTTVLDYNGDGHLDIVVASMGFISPTDDLIGSVWLLVNRGDQTFEARRLIGGLPRVADVKPIDYNRDGKIDFAVACFGWRKTGGILLLEQVTTTLFLEHRVIERNGAMQIEVADFDGDGTEDFFALFSQEHESIELYLNDGNGRFGQRTIARAPHPAWGSSGFQVVDLDRDHDLDLVCTNGDMMDEVSLAKPYHGVRWLENHEGEFLLREVAQMPGCYRAVAKDMDGDGHLDILASSLNFTWTSHDFPSLIWLRNDGRQHFTAHSILHAPTNLAAMDAGDLNDDGLTDIIVGGMHLPGPLGRVARLTAVFAAPKDHATPKKETDRP